MAGIGKRGATAVAGLAMALLLAGAAGAQEARNQPTPNKLPKTFGVIFTSMQVRDIEKSLAFYKAAFAVDVLYHYDFPDFKEYMLLFPGSPQAGGMNIVWRANVTLPTSGDRAHPVIKVADLVGTCQRILKAGGSVERPCYKPPPGTFEASFARDVDGNKLEIIQYD